MGDVKEDLSRQELTYGAEMVGKLKQMRVFIHGLRGLGIETVKNLVLAGPHTVTIHDDSPTTIEDLGTNFYLQESHVGQPRGASVLDAVKELNPNVRVHLHTGEVTLQFLEHFNVVCVCDTDVPMADLIEWNEHCRNRQNPIAFVLGLTHGVTGSVFVDMGPNHTVHDLDGEPVKTLIVDSILNQEQGSVTIDGDRHLLCDGDYVKFEEVVGMSDDAPKTEKPLVFGTNDVVTDINQIHIVKTTKNPKRFTIGNTTKLGEYKKGGIITEVKMPTILQYKSLREAVTDANALIPGYMDFAKMSNPYQQHFALLALYAFQSRHSALPRLHSSEDAAELVAIAKDLNAANKAANEKEKGSHIDVDSIDETFVTNYALYARTELTSMSALFGGIVAQEITKYTGKYTPMKQFFHFDVNDLLSEKVPEDATPVGSRYDHQIALFGAKFQNRLEKQKVFVVGCGALGCEYLKMVATSGIGTQGAVHVTDDDTIELSNLSRQFLFRRKHVKKHKSACAAQAVEVMNPTLIKALKVYTTRVEPKSEDLFNDAFWESIDLVVNALDNNIARKYTDGKCVLYQKPLFESGTLGTKANTAICIPHKTPSYSEGVVAGEGAGIAKCTLRNFPSITLHCIEWAREMFDEWFLSGPEVLNNYVEDKQGFFDKLAASPIEELENLELAKAWIELAVTRSPEACVDVMFRKFLQYFRDGINDLTHNLPESARNIDKATGTDLGAFWHGGKRFPKAAEWDPRDPLQLDFIYRGANILASVFRLKPISLEEVRELASQLHAPKWQYTGATVNLEETDKKKGEEAGEGLQGISEQKAALRDYLSNFDLNGVTSLLPAEFEKDDDTNHHVDVILAATNLRAGNYHIKLSTLSECRGVAGRIIPAIATTTACITGFVGLEILKHVREASLEARKMATINLATNVYCVENLPDPIKAKTGLDPKTYMTVKAVPEGFTTWDTIVVDAPGVTLQQFIDKFAEINHGARFTMLSINEGTLCLYTEAMNYNPEIKAKNDENLQASLLDLVVRIGGPIFPPERNYVIFDGSVDVDGDDGIVPRVKWIFRSAPVAEKNKKKKVVWRKVVKTTQKPNIQSDDDGNTKITTTTKYETTPSGKKKKIVIIKKIIKKQKQ